MAETKCTLEFNDSPINLRLDAYPFLSDWIKINILPYFYTALPEVRLNRPDRQPSYVMNSYNAY